MAVATPDVIPTVIPQGTTARWYAYDDDYPANEGWSKTYYFRGPSTASVTSATVSGGQYQTVMSATVTAGLNPGIYQWQEFSSKGNLRFLSLSGTVEVTTDLQTISTLNKSRDGRTSARKMFDAVKRILENEQSILRMAPEQHAQLLESYNKLKYEVKREEDAERIARGEVVTNKVYARFAP
jgi:hypothetical protein